MRSRENDRYVVVLECVGKLRLGGRGAHFAQRLRGHRAHLGLVILERGQCGIFSLLIANQQPEFRYRLGALLNVGVRETAIQYRPSLVTGGFSRPNGAAGEERSSDGDNDAKAQLHSGNLDEREMQIS